MGYEITMLIGRKSHGEPEYERDMDKPFDDGSGFDYKYDAHGQPIRTGRNAHFFQVVAEINLAKLGHQTDPLNLLIKASHDKGNQESKQDFHFFYGTGNGCDEISRDRYGDYMWPVPAKEVLRAVESSIVTADPYVRLMWAKALLVEVTKDNNDIEVLFYGH